MDLKVVFGIVCLCVLAITSTNAAIPKCCISTRLVPQFLLRKAIKWEMQYSNGVCDINALKLYLRGRKRPYCVDPSMNNLMNKLDKAKMIQYKGHRH